MSNASFARYEIGSTANSYKRLLGYLLAATILCVLIFTDTSTTRLDALPDQELKAELISATQQRAAKDVSIVGCTYDSYEVPYAVISVTNRGEEAAASYYIVVAFDNGTGHRIAVAYGVVDSLDPGQSKMLKATAGNPVQYSKCILSQVSKI